MLWSMMVYLGFRFLLVFKSLLTANCILMFLFTICTLGLHIPRFLKKWVLSYIHANSFSSTSVRLQKNLNKRSSESSFLMVIIYSPIFLTLDTVLASVHAYFETYKKHKFSRTFINQQQFHKLSNYPNYLARPLI